jgi:hypothetical protein
MPLYQKMGTVFLSPSFLDFLGVSAWRLDKGPLYRLVSFGSIPVEFSTMLGSCRIGGWNSRSSQPPYSDPQP